ncbi:copper homeostasis protein cutC [Endogone sp. FLAS-F59071]|nr:copper homeostasis protein cutC [Endogone sp. FLAS-F59071]|eukprot:RUS22055.1 copper homeostasis protein cutC [Endogone sp. FLAS-F59071]
MATARPKIEICLDSVVSAIGAEQSGADRVELCDNLIEGGTTPSAGMIAITKKKIKIPVMVMIRPRGGDFCYTDDEFEVMKHDVQVAKLLDADGVAFGILLPDGTVDVDRSRILVELAKPMSVFNYPVTFHRAFDVTIEPFQALEDLISIGVDRILTSGQDSTAWEGIDLITELVEWAGDRIIIMPGSGITERNVSKIVAAVHPKEIHFSSLQTIPSPMQYRNSSVFMGAAVKTAEYTLSVANSRKIGAILAKLDGSRS